MVKSAPAQHLLTVQEKKREREAIEKNKESNLEKVLSSCTWIVRSDVAKVHDKCWQWRMKERLPDGGWVFITFLEQSVDNLYRAEKHAREKLRKIHFRTNYRFFHRSRSFTREIIDSRRNINNHPAGQIVQFLASSSCSKCWLDDHQSLLLHWNQNCCQMAIHSMLLVHNKWIVNWMEQISSHKSYGEKEEVYENHKIHQTKKKYVEIVRNSYTWKQRRKSFVRIEKGFSFFKSWKRVFPKKNTT